MAPTLVSIFLSFLVFPSSFIYARYPNKQFISSTFIDPAKHTKRLIQSLNSFPNHDVKIVHENATIDNSSRLVEKIFKFPFLPNSESSFEDLGHFAGYYSLPHTRGARMFFFFCKSRKSGTDPVMIWLSGGPGSSSSVAFFYENGPFHITEDSSLVWNDYGWDKVSNILYVDQPIGTGFSYSIDNNNDLRHNLDDVTNDLYNFLQAFFNEHPELVQNDFFITGQSFAGHYAPALASRIHQENRAKNKIYINLKGIAIGNGLVNPRIQYDALPYYARRYKLIEEEDYLHIMNTMHPDCIKATENCDMGIEDECLVAFDNCDRMLKKILLIAANINYYDIRKHRNGPLPYDFSRMENFLNNQAVKDALSVPNITFVPFSSTVYHALKGEFMKNYDVGIPALLATGIKVLIYVGEFDFICNYIGNIKWVADMPWHNKAFRESPSVPYFVDDIQVGEMMSYETLSFLKVYNAGHMVPMDQPKTAFHMIQSWMKGELQ